jgi:hypothetical protein
MYVAIKKHLDKVTFKDFHFFSSLDDVHTGLSHLGYHPVEIKNGDIYDKSGEYIISGCPAKEDVAFEYDGTSLSVLYSDAGLDVLLINRVISRYNFVGYEEIGVYEGRNYIEIVLSNQSTSLKCKFFVRWHHPMEERYGISI